jgi:hypothetical protein
MNIASLKVSIGADLTGLEKGMAQASRSLQSFGKNMTATGVLLSKALTAPIAAFGAVAVNAFTKQEDAERKLAAAIATTGGEVDKNMARFKAFASELQSVTRVGDETTLQLLQVATAQGLTADSAERAARNAIAMESAFGVSASSAIRMTAALESGDATMLKRYIPALKGVEDNTLAVAMAQDILTGAFDIAKADAQTFGGQLVQLKNAFGDFQEQVGSVIAEAMTPFIRRAKELVDSLLAMDREVLKTYVTYGLLAAAIPVAVVAIGKLIAVVGLLLTPLALKIAALVAVGVAINTLIQNSQALSERFVYYFTIAKNAVLDMVSSAITSLSKLVGFVDKVLSASLTALALSIDGFKDELGDPSEFTPFIGILESLGKSFDFVADAVKSFIFTGESIGSSYASGLKQIKSDIDQVTLSAQTFESVGARAFQKVSLDAKELEKQINQLGGSYETTADKMVNLTQNLESTISSGFASIAETIGNAFTGDLGVDSFFDNIMLIVSDFSAQFGKALIAAGVAALAFQQLLINPIAAIAAGAALIGLSAVVKNVIKKGPAGNVTSVNDALITSSGKVVKFHPDDNILAMKDFGALGQSGGKVDYSRIDKLIELTRKVLFSVMPLNTSLSKVNTSVQSSSGTQVNVESPTVTVNPPNVEVFPPNIEVFPPNVEVFPPNIEVFPPPFDFDGLDSIGMLPEILVNFNDTIANFGSTLPVYDFDGFLSLDRLPDVLVNFVDTIANFGSTLPVFNEVQPQPVLVQVEGTLTGSGTELYAIIKNVERSYR